MNFIKKYKWVIVGSIVALAVIILLTFVFIKNKKVNVEDDVKVEFSGYNGSGYAHITDKSSEKITNKLLAQALRQADFKNKDVIEMIEKGNTDDLDSDKFTKEEQDQLVKAGKILESFELDIDKEDKLSNGDKIKVKLKIKKNMSKEYQLKAKEFTKEFKVSGLKNPKSLDAKSLFEGLNPTFTGLNGSGQLHLLYKDAPESIKKLSLSNFEFTVPNNGKLRNGDKVKLKVPEEVVKQINDSESTNFKGSTTYELKVKDLKDVNKLENVSTLLEDNNKLINDRFKSSSYSKSSTEQIGQYFKTSNNVDSEYDFGSSDSDNTTEKISPVRDIEETRVTLITAVKVTETSKYSDPEVKYAYSGYSNYLLEGNRLTKDDTTREIDELNSEEDLEEFNNTLDSNGFIAL